MSRVLYTQEHLFKIHPLAYVNYLHLRMPGQDDYTICSTLRHYLQTSIPFENINREQFDRNNIWRIHNLICVVALLFPLSKM